MGNQDGNQAEPWQPLKLPSSQNVQRRDPSLPQKGPSSQPRETPTPPPAHSQPEQGNQGAPPSRSRDRAADVPPVNTPKMSGAQSRKRSADLGEMPAVQSRPRGEVPAAHDVGRGAGRYEPAYDDEGADSRAYARYSDDSTHDAQRDWAEESRKYSARQMSSDPWDRDWNDWSRREVEDTYDDEYTRDEGGAKRYSRDAWGGWPDEGTAASVAINVVPSKAKPRASYNNTKRKTKSVQQLLFWVQSGFAKSAMPSRKAINLLLIVSIVGTIFLTGVGFGYTGYKDYKDLSALARDGQSALSKMGEDLGIGSKALPGQKADTNAALNDINQATADFQKIHDMVANPDAVLSLAGSVPGMREKLQSGLVLSNLALKMMGMLHASFPAVVSLTKLLASSPLSADTTTTDANAPRLSQDDMNSINNGIQAAQPYITDMIALIANTSPSTLVAVLSSKQQDQILPFLEFVPQIPNALKVLNDFTKIAPTVLGITKPLAYLITTLDYGEIRPAGGFQGQVAILGIDGGHIGKVALQDIYQLETPHSGTSSPPYNFPFTPDESWWTNYGLAYNIRNSGLSPDFPTSAQLTLNYLHALQLCKVPLVTPVPGTDKYGCPYNHGSSIYYPEGNHIPIVDAKTGKVTGYQSTPTAMGGEIAIQQSVINQLLTYTGPLQIGCPYNVSVDSTNLQQKIHYYQETDAGRLIGKNTCGDQSSDATKRFTSLVAKSLIDKIKKIKKSDLSHFLGDLLNDLKTHDIQIYLADPASKIFAPYAEGESFLNHYQASGQVYTGTEDSLMMNQANFAGDKVNLYLPMQLVDNINIDKKGTATHNLTINYKFNLPTITYDPRKNVVDSFGRYQLASNVALYNVIFNAVYGKDYAEYRRIYLPQNAQLLEGATGFAAGTGDGNPFAQTYPAQIGTDVTGLKVFGGLYDYRFEAVDNGSGTSGTIRSFAPDQVQNPTMNWYVPQVVKGGTYTLHLQRQSGVTLTEDITITSACSSKPLHVAGPVTTDMVITYQTGC